jgi:hydroxypyruvate isomerase
MKDLFSLLDQSGYEGWVSAAYVPGNGNTSQTLRWMR